MSTHALEPARAPNDHETQSQPGTVDSVEVRSFDGVHWEQSYAATGIAACGGGGSGGSGNAAGGEAEALGAPTGGGDGMAGV